MKKFSLFLLMLLLSLPVIAKQDKGKGTGGVRDDHASEMGLEKGEAWAGSKEKKVKKESEDKVKKEEKVKKEKKAKKEKRLRRINNLYSRSTIFSLHY
jgi:hypothetical protein